MYENFCGIDFGTTNSAVSVMSGNRPELIRFGNKDTIPTAVFFPEDKSGILYGDSAINEYISGGLGRFMRSIKRILGTDLMNVRTDVNGKLISYEDIIFAFIKHLKETTENKIQKPIVNVVMGRPVHFQDFAPELDDKAESVLKKIARRAGFINVDFLYEPLAAAYSHEIALESEKLACVVDIGGGTSDFSIIKLGGNKRQDKNRQTDILANDGMRIGGNDFDFDLSVNCFMPQFGYGTQLKPDSYTNRILPVPLSPYIMLSEWSSVNTLYTYKEQKSVEQIYKNAAEPEKVVNLYETVQKELGHRLLNNIEKSKIWLTEQKTIKSKLDFLMAKPEITVTVSDFEASIASNANKIKAVLQGCIKQADVLSEQIDIVILTGGSTAIPYIKRIFTGIFPNAAVSEAAKLSSVATGLAYEAKRLYK